MKTLTGILLVVISVLEIHSRNVEFTNRCGYDIWVNPLTNAQGPPLPDGMKKLSNGASHTYRMPDSGWGGRFWPKTGCDNNGQNCEVGQSVDPCGLAVMK